MKTHISPACHLTTALLIMVATITCNAIDFSIYSPDQSIEMKVRVTGQIYYNLSVDGTELMTFSPLAMQTSQGNFGDGGTLVNDSVREVAVHDHGLFWGACSW